MTREYFSPEEREEYDDLLAEAGFEPNGARRPSQEIGTRMHELLEDALRAGRSWADWVLDSDADAGHLARWKRWDKARNRMRVVTPAGEVVPRAAVIGVRRRGEDGTAYYQQAIWRDATWAEVEEKMAQFRAQLDSAQIGVETAQRLLVLREHAPESVGPAAACLLLGLDMDAYLAGEQEIA